MISFAGRLPSILNIAAKFGFTKLDLTFWIPTIMHHERAIAHGEVMHVADRQVPHARGARDDAHRYDSGGAAVGFSYRLAHVQLARHEPAVVRRQPRMVGRGVDRLVRRGMGATLLRGDLLG